MSKAQTDVVAALRIELDDTKAALAKAREDLSHALHSLDETKQCCDERRTQAKRAEKAEAACAALRESLEEANLVACYDECDHYGDTIVHNKECRAVADLLASPNPGEGWVSPEAHAALRTERDALTKQLSEIQRMPELPWAGVTAAIMQRAATLAREGYQGAALEIRDVLDRGKVYVSRLNAERDSLRERLGDAERVLAVARELHPLPIDAALAEYDAKRGKQ